MPAPETKTKTILRRLKSEGWQLVEGGAHTKLSHPDRPEALITVPRHTEVSVGVARSIAKAAGWTKKG